MNILKFKQTEIGMIPEDWEFVPIITKCHIIMGQSPESKYYNTSHLGAPFSQGITTFGDKYPTIDIWTTNITKMAKKGSVLFSVRAPVGEVNICNVDTCIGRGLLSIDSKNNQFMYYLLKAFKGYIVNKEKGTVYGSVTQEDVKNIELPFPSLPEQQAIAKILSDLDSKIELNRKMNQTLEEIGKNLFKRWFIDFEFPNEKGEPYKSSGGELVYNEELKKEIPKGWIMDKLENQLATLESGNRPRGGASLLNEGIPSIGAENIYGLGMYDYRSTKYVPEDFFNKMNQGIVKNKDVLLYKDGASLGRKTMFMCDFPYKKCCINEHVFILRSKEIIGNFYLYFWLDQDFMTDKIIGLNTNSAQPGITRTGVYTLPILLANNKLILQFNKTIDPILQLIFFNCIQNQTLSATRDSLLPKLMSGKIRVS